MASRVGTYCRTVSVRPLCTNNTGLETYAMGRARRHLLYVSSPWAEIFLGSPSNSMHLGSLLILSTTRLKCAVLLSREKTSVYKTYATPPWFVHERQLCTRRGVMHRMTCRDEQSCQDQTEIESLLCSSCCLFACRKFRPWNGSGIIEWRDRSALRLGCGGRSQTRLCRIIPLYKQGLESRRKAQCRRSSNRKRSRIQFHHGGSASAIVRGR